MEDLDRIFDKLEKIDNKLNSIDKTLVEQHFTLEDHTKRSEANEEAIELLKKELKAPLIHYHISKSIFKVCVGIFGSGALIEILHYLLK